MEVKIVTPTHDLAKLVAEINQAKWDQANDMVVYGEAALRAYLEQPDTLFVSCHDQGVFMGMASARLEMKPYANERWLYVDEVDVCADQRQKGAGKAIMQLLLEIAEQHDCEELWLGTEVDNLPANALYKALGPQEVEQFIGYTYEMP